MKELRRIVTVIETKLARAEAVVRRCFSNKISPFSQENAYVEVSF